MVHLFVGSLSVEERSDQRCELDEGAEIRLRRAFVVPRADGRIEHPRSDDAAPTVHKLDADGVWARLDDAHALGEMRMPTVVDRQHRRVSTM